jgi:small redox-active disulfide protein 2
MKKLTVLGPGCARCKKLTELTENAAKSLGIDYELEKITDITKIAEHGVMSTPVLIVDGEIKVAGNVPSEEQLKKILV